MIALVVLSIGLLGVARLQVFGLEATDDSHRRTMATFMANDIADRMRANLDGAANGYYDDLDSTTITVPSDPGCVTSFCTALQMANTDKREWLDHFVNVSGATGWIAALDGGAGAVTRVGDRLTVTITWKNSERTWDATAGQSSSATVTKAFVEEFDL